MIMRTPNIFPKHRHRPLVLLAATAMMASCAGTAPTKPPTAQPANEVAGPADSIGTVASHAAPREPVLIPGTGQFIGAAKAADDGVSTTAEGINLNFVEVDVRAVLTSVLTDALGISYTIDPAVKGTITLQSAHPLSKEELFKSLEAALRLQDIAIVSTNAGYAVMPLKDAPRHVGVLRTPESASQPGFGIEAVPLRYVSAAEMEKILTPFAPSGGILRSDDARNLILLAGTGPELSSMLDIVRQFDVDWLRGMSYALYPVDYVDAKTLVDELNQIFLDTKSPLNGVVKLVPLPRLSTVLVATSSPDYLKSVGDWIKRLDRGDSSPGRRIYVYDVQNGRASDLAQTLDAMFGLATVNPASGSSGGYGQGSVYNGAGGLGGQAGGYGNGTFGRGAIGQVGNPYSQLSPAMAASGTGQTAGIAGLLSPGNNTIASLDSLGLRLVPNDDSNSLLILASPSEFGVIENALKRLDVAPRQVLIEASLAEVTLTDEIKFGIQWMFQSSIGKGGFSPTTSSAIAQSFPGFSYMYTGASNIQAVLNAIESITKVKVLSSPELMVVNNKEADIQVGDQVPVLSQQSVSTDQSTAPIVNSVQQRDTGVILHVTPRVNKSGMVTLDIDQEVSNVVPTTSSNIDSPTIQQRKISSSVVVHDGETIALGGLISETKSNGRTGLPWLSRIPLFGWLFGATDNSSQRNELIVLIRPRVVQNTQELQDLTADLREQFKDVLPKTAKAEDPKNAAKP